MEKPEEEVLSSFLSEFTEALAGLEPDFVRLEESPDDTQIRDGIFRCIHSLKGNSSFLGFTNLTTISHGMETLLDDVRKKKMGVDSSVMNILLEGTDVLRNQLSIISQGSDAKSLSPEEEGFLERLSKVQQNDQGGDSHLTVSSAKGDHIDSEELGKWQEICSKLRSDLESILKEKGNSDIESKFSQSLSFLHEQIKRSRSKKARDLVDDIEDAYNVVTNSGVGFQKEIVEIFQEKLNGLIAWIQSQLEKFASQQKNGQSVSTGVGPQKASSAVRMVQVSQNKIDEFLDLIGTLIISEQALKYFFKKIAEKGINNSINSKLNQELITLKNVTDRLQTSMLEIRRVPAGKLFQKFPRMVRDLSQKLDKPIKLDIQGSEVMIDKDLAEKLENALVHIIRNSADHGIESKIERGKSGKDPTGTITLKAKREESIVSIQISDDGRGIDPERIRRTACQTGLMDEETLKNLSDTEAINLVCIGGLTTASDVSEVSGRGVGMDAVMTAVVETKGDIKIDSEVGKYTMITIKVPLSSTLVVKPAIIVRLAGQNFAILAEHITAMVVVEKNKIQNFRQFKVFSLRENLVVLIPLDISLGLDRERTDTFSNEKMQVILTDNEQSIIGFAVDELVAQQNIVVRDFDHPLFNKADNLCGVTIMEDGEVVPIIDIKKISGCMERKKARVPEKAF